MGYRYWEPDTFDKAYIVFALTVKRSDKPAALERSRLSLIAMMQNLSASGERER